MLAVCTWFSEFLETRQDRKSRDQEEGAPGVTGATGAMGEEAVGQGSGRSSTPIWQRVTVRGSKRTGEMMIMVLFDADRADAMGAEGAAEANQDLVRYLLAKETNAATGDAVIAGEVGEKKEETEEKVESTPLRITQILVRGKREGNTMDGPPVLLYDSSTGGKPSTAVQGSGTNEGNTRAGIREILLGVPLHISPLAFFQVHTDAAEVLYSLIAQCCDKGYCRDVVAAGDEQQQEETTTTTTKKKQHVLLDVCCGTGSIGLSIADHFEAVLGIELSSDAIIDAARNAQSNKLVDRARFVCGRAEDVVPRVVTATAAVAPTAMAGKEAEGGGTGREGSAAEAEAAAWFQAHVKVCEEERGGGIVAVVDPPRTGMHPAVCQALRACPRLRRLVFVSCNPTNNYGRWDFVVRKGSLSDNAVLLCGPEAGKVVGAPFQLSFSCAVDMFPYTPHCELITVFER